MTTIVVDKEKLRQLDEATREAWAVYGETLRGLSSDEYEWVESASWDQLQVELRSLETQRRALESARG